MASDSVNSEGEIQLEEIKNQNNIEKCRSDSNHQPLLATVKQEPDPEESDLEIMQLEPITQIKEEDDGLFECTYDTVLSMLTEAASAYDITLDWKCEMLNDTFLCSIFFNNFKVITAGGPSLEIAKMSAIEVALRELQKISENLVTIKDSKDCSNLTYSSNRGMKMMKLMGWSGGGLGKASQGITEPVSVHMQSKRTGLGYKPGMCSKKAFKKRLKNILPTFIKGGTFFGGLTGTLMEVCTPTTLVSVKAPQPPESRTTRKEKKKEKQRNIEVTQQKKPCNIEATQQKKHRMKLRSTGRSAPPASPQTQSTVPTNGTPHPREPEEVLKTHQEDPVEDLRLKLNKARASARSKPTELKLAIVPERYPEERLNVDQAQLVVHAVVAALLDIAEGYVPRFRENWLVRGAQVFHCNAREDMEWLLHVAPGLVPWEGAKLRVTEQSALPHVERLTVSVPGELAPDVVLKCLGKQNGTLRVQEWTVVQSWQARDETKGTAETMVGLLAEEPQVEALRALGCQPFCGAGKANVIIHMKNNDEGALPQMFGVDGGEARQL